MLSSRLFEFVLIAPRRTYTPVTTLNYDRSSRFVDIGISSQGKLLIVSADLLMSESRPKASCHHFGLSAKK
eukprot:2255064-Pleurochrysis_carterae.AAC.1